MSMQFKAFILLILFSTLGCSADKKMNYKTKKVFNINYELDDTKLKLSYKPFMATLYYSPGVDIIENDNELIIIIRKCDYDEKCEVGIKSTSELDPELGIINNITINLKKSFIASQIFINEPNKENSLKVLSGT